MEARKKTKKCDECDYVARDVYNLSRHKLSHLPVELRCGYCRKLFPNAQKTREHKAVCDRCVSCSHCNATFRGKPQLKIHIKTRHRPDQLAAPFPHQCPLCLLRFLKRTEIDHHLVSAHGMILNEEKLVFQTVNEFYDWKRELELSTSTYYSNRDAWELAERRRIYFRCYREGTPKCLPPEKRVRKLKTLGSNKMNAYCPGRMIVDQYINGYMEVTLVATHVGHDFEVERLNLTSHYRAELANKISKNVPLNDILINDKMERGLKRKDLLNIIRDFKIKKQEAPNRGSTLLNKSVNILKRKSPVRINQQALDYVDTEASNNLQIVVAEKVDTLLSESTLLVDSNTLDVMDPEPMPVSHSDTMEVVGPEAIVVIDPEAMELVNSLSAEGVGTNIKIGLNQLNSDENNEESIMLDSQLPTEDSEDIEYNNLLSIINTGDSKSLEAIDSIETDTEEQLDAEITFVDETTDVDPSITEAEEVVAVEKSKVSVELNSIGPRKQLGTDNIDQSVSYPHLSMIEKSPTDKMLAYQQINFAPNEVPTQLDYKETNVDQMHSKPDHQLAVTVDQIKKEEIHQQISETEVDDKFPNSLTDQLKTENQPREITAPITNMLDDATSKMIEVMKKATKPEQIEAIYKAAELLNNAMSSLELPSSTASNEDLHDKAIEKPVTVINIPCTDTLVVKNPGEPPVTGDNVVWEIIGLQISTGFENGNELYYFVPQSK